MSEHPLAGWSVLVTGASSGIGAATARILAGHGVRLGLTARRTDLLEQVGKECEAAGSPDVRVWSADLSDVGQAEQVADTAWEAFGGLDGVVNNAGIPKRRNVAKLSFDDVVQTMKVNYLAP